MFLGSKARLVRRADNLTAICEPIVYTMWDPQHLTTLSASKACYGDSFTFFFYFYWYIWPFEYRYQATQSRLTPKCNQELNVSFLTPWRMFLYSGTTSGPKSHTLRSHYLCYRVLLYRRGVLGGTASFYLAPFARSRLREEEFGRDNFRWGRGPDQEATV
jgi:hypothetical protein